MKSVNLANLAPAARGLMTTAMQSAKDNNHSNVSPWVLFALMYQSDDSTSPSSPTRLLVENGLNQEAFVTDIKAKMDATRSGIPGQPVGIDEALGDVLQKAIARETPASLQTIWTEMLLNKTLSESLVSWGVKPDARQNILRTWGINDVAELAPDSAVAKYCKDLTAQAREGDLDPVVGRDDEIREAMNILQRRFKNNPIFVGETGVGKTAMVEGIAQRMVKNEVPESLKGKSLLSLDVSTLVAGAKYKGELEERVKSLVKEIQDRDDVVLFIDEIHTIVNSSDEASGVGQLLKPALARGELRCIGATTPDEYRIHLEKDPALERRFEKITVMEPSFEESVAILRGVKDRYVIHHGVDITDQALIAAVEFSSRYMTDRFLPDKAIDLIDSAAARQRTILDSKPEQMDKIDRAIMQLSVQRAVIKREEESEGELDPDTKKQLEKVENKIECLGDDLKVLEEKFKEEKVLHEKSMDLEKKLSEEKLNLQKAQQAGDLALIGRLNFNVIPDIEKELRVVKKTLRQLPDRMMEDQVGVDAVAEIVSRRTGVPVNKMQGSEQERLANMEEILNKQVIGQPDAVESVSDAVRRSRSGLGDPKRPIGSFMFAGSSGVGKTELCKVLSSFLFERKEAMVRIDMSEFMEKQAVARLIGAPPGYVGYEEGGVLTEAIRQHPYSVVLFDEVEKAHPDVFNVLLQVLDEGHLTDGRGRKVDFKNTVVIMTSNLGSSEIQELAAKGEGVEAIRDAILNNMKTFFRPEFINRLDEIVAFRPLGKEDIAKIAVIQTNSLVKRLAERKIQLELTQAAIDHLAEAGFDPQNGARPLKRAIQQELENPLAKDIVSGRVRADEIVRVDAAGGSLSWSTSPAPLLTDEPAVEKKEYVECGEVSATTLKKKINEKSGATKTKKSAVPA